MKRLCMFFISCFVLPSGIAMAENDDVKAVFNRSADSNIGNKISSYWACNTSKGNFSFALFNRGPEAGYIYMFEKEGNKVSTKHRIRKWSVSAVGRRNGSILMSIKGTSDSYIEISRLTTSDNRPRGFSAAVQFPDIERRAASCQEIKIP